MEKYTLEQVKNDPRSNRRATQALIRCIEAGKLSAEEIFAEIDKAYQTGKHRSPSYLRYAKVDSLKFLAKIELRPK